MISMRKVIGDHPFFIGFMRSMITTNNYYKEKLILFLMKNISNLSHINRGFNFIFFCIRGKKWHKK